MKKKTWLIAAGVVAALLILIVIWALNLKGPGEAAQEILEYSDAMTIVENDLGIIFCPVFPTETIGLIFYPGAHVDPRSYAPIMYQIAQAGVPVVVLNVPFGFSTLAADAPDEVINTARNFPCQNEISEWYIGGHSLGGVSAASYVFEHQEQVAGLVLWGSYPAKNVDLSNSTMSVLSVFGSMDKLTTYEEVNASRSQVPQTAQFLGISGANHAQFGDYGAQAGDGEAQIEPSEQWSIVTDLTLQFLYTVPLE